MQRQLIHAVDETDLAWLKAAADADGTSVGEIVRRCIAYAREMAEAAASVLDEPSVQQHIHERSYAQVQAARDADLPEPDYRGSFQDRKGNHVKSGDRVVYQTSAINARHGVLEDALQDGDAYVRFDDTGETETVKWNHLYAEPTPEPDYSDEPRAEEIDIPADPDEDASLIRSPPVLQQRPKPATFRPLPSLMDTVAAVPTPIAGQATRPVGANPERLASGDVRGRVQLQNLQRQKFVGFGG